MKMGILLATWVCVGCYRTEDPRDLVDGGLGSDATTRDGRLDQTAATDVIAEGPTEQTLLLQLAHANARFVERCRPVPLEGERIEQVYFDGIYQVPMNADQSRDTRVAAYVAEHGQWYAEFLRAQSSGLIRYDAQALAQCLDSDACRPVERCLSAIAGSVADGQRCTIDEVCYGTTSGCIDGRCMDTADLFRPQVLGCPPCVGLHCAYLSEHGGGYYRCVPVRDEEAGTGQYCGGDDQDEWINCTRDLRCLSQATGYLCTDPNG